MRGGTQALGLLLGAALSAAACGDDNDSKQAARRAAVGEQCLINTDCSDPLVCVFERCHYECEETRDCEEQAGAGVRCMLGSKPSNVCQIFVNCDYDSQCEGNQVCGPDNQCRDQCRTDRDCVPEQVCVSGVCAGPGELVDGQLPNVPGGPDVGRPCSYTSECPEPLVCLQNECRAECLGDRDCTPGWACLDSRCRAPSSTGGSGGGGQGGQGGSAGAPTGGTGAAGGAGGSGAAGTGGTGGSGGLPSHCFNKLVDGDESAEDCGGSCEPCGVGFSCGVGADCESGVCGAGSKCDPPSCYDSLLNGTETDVDCGGPSCGPCATGAACQLNGDCASVACSSTSNTCIDSSCIDGEKNGTETGTDCGGSCSPCDQGAGCQSDIDCAGTLLCDGSSQCAESFLLNVTVLGTGPGSVTDDRAKLSCPGVCSARYVAGQSVTLSQSSNGGSAFSGWGGDCSGPSTCAVLMDSDRAVTATFDGGAATEWLAKPTASLSGSGSSRGGAIVVRPDQGFFLTGSTYNSAASPCGSVITQGMWLASYDALGTCTSGFNTASLPGAARALGLGLSTTGKVLTAFETSGNPDWGAGVLNCPNMAGIAISAFSPSSLGIDWQTPCISVRSATKAWSVGNDLALVGSVEDGDDLRDGPISVSDDPYRGLLAVYSGTDGSLVTSYQLDTESELFAVQRDGAGGYVIAGRCSQHWDPQTQTWTDTSAAPICVRRLDSNLQTVWTRSWPVSQPATGNAVAFRALALGPGNPGSERVVAVGSFGGSFTDSAGSRTSNGSRHDLIVVVLDGSSGASVATNSAGSSSDDYGLRVALDGNGDIWVAGLGVGMDFGDGNVVGGSYGPFYAQYSPDLVLESVTKLHLGGSNSYGQIYDLEETPDGGLVFFGHNGPTVNFGPVLGTHGGSFVLKLAP